MLHAVGLGKHVGNRPGDQPVVGRGQSGHQSGQVPALLQGGFKGYLLGDQLPAFQGFNLQVRVNHRAPEIVRVGDVLDVQGIITPYERKASQQGRGNVIRMDRTAGGRLPVHCIGDQGGGFKGGAQQVIYPHNGANAAGRTGSHAASGIDLLPEHQVEALLAAQFIQQGTGGHGSHILFRIQGQGTVRFVKQYEFTLVIGPDQHFISRGLQCKTHQVEPGSHVGYRCGSVYLNLTHYSGFFPLVGR